MEKAKEGDRFIKPDTGKIYVIARVVIGGNWAILKEEWGDQSDLNVSGKFGNVEKIGQGVRIKRVTN